MNITHGHTYNFNISTIQNKSRKNIKVIFIVTYGIHSYEYDYSGQKYLCGFSLVTFDIFLTSRRIVNLVLLYAQYFFFQWRGVRIKRTHAKAVGASRRPERV